jgi:hypothetical protein
MAIKDVTSTSFGLVIAYLLPGFVALFSLSFWFDSAQRAFHTFLTSQSNVGLFLFLLLGGLALGLAVNAVRLALYELLLGRIKRLYGERPTREQLARLSEADNFAAFRAAIDELYRYHQFYGGTTLAGPALFVGWLNSLDVSSWAETALIAGFAVAELTLVVATISTLRSFYGWERRILST